MNTDLSPVGGYLRPPAPAGITMGGNGVDETGDGA